MNINHLTQQAENLIFNIGQKAPYQELHTQALSLLKELYLMEQQSRDSGKKHMTFSEKESIEMQKIERKIPLWFSNSASIPGNILFVYLDARRHGGGKAKITQETLEDILFNKLKVVKFDREVFKRNFAQMKNFAEKNHAKIFDEEEDGNITIWQPMENYVRIFYDSCGGGGWDEVMKNAYPNYKTLNKTVI